MEVYVAEAESKYSDKSVWFAFQMQAALYTKLGFESRGVKFANFQVLRETIDYCASVLLELGFLSNGDETAYFIKAPNINRVSVSILSVIKKEIFKH